MMLTVFLAIMGTMLAQITATRSVPRMTTRGAVLLVVSEPNW
jgi:hypothetical protein